MLTSFFSSKQTRMESDLTCKEVFVVTEHFKNVLLNSIKGSFVILLDESLNKKLQSKQIDVHVHFWDGNPVHTRYLGLQFIDFLYSSLNQSTTSIFRSKIGLKTRQEHKKDVIRSFLKLHLPAKRLLANEDDMSQRYVPLNNSSHWRFSLIKQKGKSKKIKNREQRRKIFDISKNAQSYDRYLPLHHMWTQYMEQIVSSNCSPRNMQTSCHKVMKADLHGCILTVHRSKCPSYVGLQGIVLQETRNIIKILTQNNTVKSVPKIKTEFSFELNDHIFTIHGNHFRIKTGERSSRKFKSRSTTDL